MLHYLSKLEVKKDKVSATETYFDSSEVGKKVAQMEKNFIQYDI